ncbi:inactive pancreatic lipase-related protein 1-like [Physella acuta]|uniref:inactive pancreatic lipase-related protein 1-like n=1 Tax=Physella acuta TaxID=109671 RepID=UPI0027DE8A5E|nr:inactive pancreatic lipase-related protein 1-like [Physella acuta]
MDVWWFLLFSAVVCEELKADTQGKREVACYDQLGCFAAEGPFGYSPQRPLTVTPEDPAKIGTIFKLYTRDGLTSSLDLQATSLDTLTSVWPQFIVRPTKILAHGFLDNISETPYQKDLKDELLKYGDFNVIIVDWAKGNRPPYTQATANTRIVGAQIALLVNQLIRTSNMSAADFHLIGHSLGAHICGYAGERIPGLGRISGIDPAGPYFENTDPAVRLDPTDALYVDAIHTDGETLLELALGMKASVGHVDFYPNLGHDQPGCNRNPFKQISEWGITQGSVELLICNHMRAFHYFVESINSKCPFLGFPCDNEDDYKNGRCDECGPDGCIRMGYHADQNKPTNGRTTRVYMTTANKQPFCEYHLDVSVKISATQGQEERGELTALISGENGIIGPFLLNPVPVNFQLSDVHTFHVHTSTDVGNIRTVTLSFQQMFELLDPLHWNLFGLRQPKIVVDEISVSRLEAKTESRFCTGGLSIQTGHAIAASTPCL